MFVCVAAYKFILNFTYIVCSIRILPHKQNSGGFFVAVLHKLRPLHDGQNLSKLCAAAREPASDECAVIAGQPDVTESNSTVMDSCSRTKSNAQDTAIVPGAKTSDQPVSDSIIHPGWLSINKTT